MVDDSHSMRAFARAVLADGSDTMPPAEVTEASSGFEALRLLPRGPYDLVITDINMPDINGLELVQFMRNSELHKETPILLISTQASPRDSERGLALGANGFLKNPFGAEELLLAAAEQLGVASDG